MAIASRALPERVVLVAAAADGADDPAVGEDEHLGAGPLRRRAVRADDGHKRGRLAARERISGGGQDLFVQNQDLDLGFLLQRVNELVGL